MAQAVVPVGYRTALIKLAHESPLAGRLGVRKAVDRLRLDLYWPNMSRDVAKFIKWCHLCQVVRKPNSNVLVAPLIPITAVEPPLFRVIIDMVGPLSPTY